MRDVSGYLNVSGFINISWAIVIQSYKCLFYKQFHMCSSQQHPLFKNGWPLEPWVEDPLLKTCDLLSFFFVPQLLRPFVVRGECWRLEYTIEFWRVDTKYTVMMGWKRKGYSKLHHFLGIRYPSQNVHGWQLCNYLGKNVETSLFDLHHL